MRSGYHTVTLSNRGVAKTWRAHALVLTAFVGDRPIGAQTRHLNGIRSDNRLANLAWGSAVENHADKVRHGTAASHYRGKFYSDHPNGKISEAQACAIEFMCRHYKQRDVAMIVGVHQSTISNVLRRLKDNPPRAARISGWDDEWVMQQAGARHERQMGRQGT
jgi:hypothetical protein